MPKNNIQRLVPADLAEFAANMLGGLPTTDPNAYGVSAAERNDLAQALAGLASANLAVGAANAAYRAAVQARLARRRRLRERRRGPRQPDLRESRT